LPSVSHCCTEFKTWFTTRSSTHELQAKDNDKYKKARYASEKAIETDKAKYECFMFSKKADLMFDPVIQGLD